MFLTDMQIGGYGGIDLESVKKYATKNIYTTFVGVGLDFDAELVQKITTNIRGANYDSVKDAKSFKKALDRDFAYSITTIAHSLKVSLLGDNYKIEAIYGAPNANAVTPNQIVPETLSREVMSIGTLFPGSANSADEIRGCIMLMKIKHQEGKDASPIMLRVQYEDRRGEPHEQDTCVQIPPYPEGKSRYFQNKGIRKAVLLTEYTILIRETLAKRTPQDQKETIQKFTEHFLEEMGELGDKRLFREIKILQKLTEPPQPEPYQRAGQNAPVGRNLMGPQPRYMGPQPRYMGPGPTAPTIPYATPTPATGGTAPNSV